MTRRSIVVGAAFVAVTSFLLVSDYAPRAGAIWNILNSHTVFSIPYRWILISCAAVVAVAILPPTDLLSVKRSLVRGWCGDREWQGWAKEVSLFIRQILPHWLSLPLAIAICCGGFVGYVVWLGVGR